MCPGLAFYSSVVVEDSVLFFSKEEAKKKMIDKLLLDKKILVDIHNTVFVTVLLE